MNDIQETTKSELPAANMKLIHSGKVLKDDATIESCNIKPSDFLVVMIAKAKKTAAAAAAPKEEVKPAAVAAPPAAAAASTEATASTTTTAAAPAPSATTTESSSAEADDEFPTEVINNLKALGFPESDCRACLRASNGNPDVAVEFLMNGIPPGISASTAAGSSSAGASSSSSSTGTGALEALRHHPQFNDLKRLVQTNPNMLSAVLQQIGQQQPELLQAINANQAEFLQMMNEPVGSTGGSGGSGGGGGAANPAPAAGANNNNPFSGSSGSASNAGMPPGMEALGNPAQLAAMLQSMPPQEQHAMASMMGMTVDQLQQTAQMISAMPQEQVQQYMNMAMQGAGGPGMGGLGGMMGGAGGMGGGGGGAGAQVLRLSEEEMAAVNRLTEMGFDRAAAAQAYLACDKNEALAANLLMDGGFADFGDDGADMGGGGGGGDDDMYD
jgi:UV excision repair protein RAD23